MVTGSSLDDTWQSFNTVGDAVIQSERVQKLQADLIALANSKSKLEKFQDLLRSWLGLDSLSNTVSASVKDGALSVIIDPKRLSARDTSELIALYERASNLSLTGSTLAAKSSIQDALVQTLPAKEAKRYQEIFARGSLYDSWQTIDQNLPEVTALLKNRMQDFARSSSSSKTLCSIQKGLPTSRIEQANQALANFKKGDLNIEVFGSCFFS